MHSLKTMPIPWILHMTIIGFSLFLPAGVFLSSFLNVFLIALFNLLYSSRDTVPTFCGGSRLMDWMTLHMHSDIEELQIKPIAYFTLSCRPFLLNLPCETSQTKASAFAIKENPLPLQKIYFKTTSPNGCFVTTPLPLIYNLELSLLNNTVCTLNIRRCFSTQLHTQ